MSSLLGSDGRWLQCILRKSVLGDPGLQDVRECGLVCRGGGEGGVGRVVKILPAGEHL